MKTIVTVLSLLAFVTLGQLVPPSPASLPPPVYTETVTLEIDPSPDAGVGAYRFHWGTASGTYTNATNSGLSLVQSIEGLQVGETYYFAATAIGTNQLESEFSNEISHVVEAPESPPSAPNGLTELQMPQLSLHIEGKNGTNWVPLDVVTVNIVTTQAFGLFRVRLESKAVNYIRF